MCEHQNAVYVRAMARHGDADLIVGAEVVFASSNNGTALAEWCPWCGALKVNGKWQLPIPAENKTSPEPEHSENCSKGAPKGDGTLFDCDCGAAERE